MSEQIREQVSEFLDGELPSTETELLLKRLARDPELRESFGRYALIGESLRGSDRSSVTRGFAARVNSTIDGEPMVTGSAPMRAHTPRWWRPIAGAAVAAGVAAVAVVALQQRAVAPGLHALPLAAQNVAASNVTASSGAAPQRVARFAARSAATPGAAPKEAIAYTVPAVSSNAPAVMPAARLTNYIFAHSRYSSVLGQSNVLSGLLASSDEPGPADQERPADETAADDAAESRPSLKEERSAP